MTRFNIVDLPRKEWFICPKCRGTGVLFTAGDAHRSAGEVPCPAGFCNNGLIKVKLVDMQIPVETNKVEKGEEYTEGVSGDGATILRDGIPIKIKEVLHSLNEYAWLRTEYSKANDEICQTLGRALKYPKFVDDQKNFPGATEESGVCVGDHVAESIAIEAARHIGELNVRLEAEIQRKAKVVTSLLDKARQEGAESMKERVLGTIRSWSDMGITKGSLANLIRALPWDHK
jgi:hypothetical protein